MADILSLGASAAGGGLFGLIGTALGRLAGFAERRQEQAHERARWAHQLALQDLRAAQSEQEHLQRSGEIEAAGRWDGLERSIAAEAAIGDTYHWVNAVRALTRPILTMLLWGIAACIWVGANDAARAAITETTTFAATAATLWWFGDRAPRITGSR